MKLSNSILEKSSVSFSNNSGEKEQETFNPFLEMPIVAPFAEILDELKGLEEVELKLKFCFNISKLRIVIMKLLSKKQTLNVEN